MDTIRLLECRVCGDIEELPGYDGPAERDDLLEIAASRHRHPGGENGQLWTGIPAAAWRSSSERRKILQLISERSGAGLGDDFYNTKNTFQHDAIMCWKKHLKPAPYCLDYRDDSKKLIPDTAALRKEEGLAKPSDLPTTRYLCDFCPVHANVEHAQNRKNGIG